VHCSEGSILVLENINDIDISTAQYCDIDLVLISFNIDIVIFENHIQYLISIFLITIFNI